jgi:hypothetical protein
LRGKTDISSGLVRTPGITIEENMTRKKYILIGGVIGSIAGGYIPMLFGVDSISVSLLCSVIGGFLGIWGAYKFFG